MGGVLSSWGFLTTSTEIFPSLPIHTKETFKSPLIPCKELGFVLVFFAFSVSTSVMLLLGVPVTTSNQFSEFNYLLLSIACLTFFLATILSALLLIMNSAKLLGPIFTCLIEYFSIATLMSSFTTLVFALPNLNELSQLEVGWAIQPGLVCFGIAMLYKLIRQKFTSYHNQSLSVAFLTLCIAVAGLYIDSLFYLPGTIPYNSIIDQTYYFYHFVLVPVTFVMGAILVILGVIPPVADLMLPYVSVTFKERLTISTLAVGTTTMIISVSLVIYAALVNLSMAGGFTIGGLKEP
jgi:hypothetical protein